MWAEMLNEAVHIKIIILGKCYSEKREVWRAGLRFCVNDVVGKLVANQKVDKTQTVH